MVRAITAIWAEQRTRREALPNSLKTGGDTSPPTIGLNCIAWRFYLFFSLLRKYAAGGRSSKIPAGLEQPESNGRGQLD
jgi:hypothetical protein